MANGSAEPARFGRSLVIENKSKFWYAVVLYWTTEKAFCIVFQLKKIFIIKCSSWDSKFSNYKTSCSWNSSSWRRSGGCNIKKQPSLDNWNSCQNTDIGRKDPSIGKHYNRYHWCYRNSRLRHSRNLHCCFHHRKSCRLCTQALRNLLVEKDSNTRKRIIDVSATIATIPIASSIVVLIVTEIIAFVTWNCATTWWRRCCSMLSNNWSYFLWQNIHHIKCFANLCMAPDRLMY